MKDHSCTPELERMRISSAQVGFLFISACRKLVEMNQIIFTCNSIKYAMCNVYNNDNNSKYSIYNESSFNLF